MITIWKRGRPKWEGFEHLVIKDDKVYLVLFTGSSVLAPDGSPAASVEWLMGVVKRGDYYIIDLPESVAWKVCNNRRRR